MSKPALLAELSDGREHVGLVMDLDVRDALLEHLRYEIDERHQIEHEYDTPRLVELTRRRTRAHDLRRPSLMHRRRCCHSVLTQLLQSAAAQVFVHLFASRNCRRVFDWFLSCRFGCFRFVVLQTKRAETIHAKFVLQVLPRFCVEFELVGLMVAVVFEVDATKVVALGCC